MTRIVLLVSARLRKRSEAAWTAPTTKVKGMFVRPEQIAEIGKRHSELARLRLVLRRKNEQDAMTLKCECGSPGKAQSPQRSAP